MIDVIADQPWNRGPMDPGPIDREYFEAAAQGRLIIQKCTNCGNTQFPPKTLCVSCGQTPEWIETSGKGQVHTFTIVRRHGIEPFSGLTPFVLAMIDLPEGARLMGNVTDIDVEDVHVGQNVEAYAWRIDETLALPLWRPAQN